MTIEPKPKPKPFPSLRDTQGRVAAWLHDIEKDGGYKGVRLGHPDLDYLQVIHAALTDLEIRRRKDQEYQNRRGR